MNNPDVKKKKKQNKIALKLLLFFIVVIAVIVMLAAAASKGKLNTDSFLRFFIYIGLDVDDGQFELIKLDSHVTNLYKGFGSSLAVLSSSDFRIFGSSGDEVFSKQAFFGNPALEASEKYAVAYDRGGGYIIVADKRGEIMLEDEFSGAIVRADINDRGYMALVTQQSGSKSTVRVFDPKMNEIYRWHASSRYIVSACVSDDGKMLAVGCIGQNDVRFQSSVVTFMLNSTEQYSEYIIEDSLMLSVSFAGQNKICAVTEDKLVFITKDATDAAEFSYMGMYLENYHAARDYALVFLNRFRAGGRAEAVLIDTNGAEIRRVRQNDEILAVSSNDKYIAILFSDKLSIYNAAFDQYAELTDTQGASSVLIRKDGSAILLDSVSARLFIP